MKKIMFLAAVFISVFGTLNAQNYETAIGLRGGLSNGITVKHFLTDVNAIEGILSTRWGGFGITGLYEFNNKTAHEGLDWYYGVGAHFGAYDGSETPWGDTDVSYSVIGIDGIIGIEYTFATIPLNLSLDYKPALNLVGYNGFWGDNTAFSIRYAF